MKLKSSFEHIFITTHLLKWSLISIPVAAVVGSLIALFLWLLDQATQLRHANNWLLFLLPVAGVLIYLLYRYLGKNSEAGNNLIMDEIHKPGGGVPLRMAPLVLITTVVTHLFGGSAGREGTAVQIGGSLAGLFGKWFKLKEEDLKIILLMGIAAGFGAVFGTPLTGAIFALEVLAIGRISHVGLLPCLLASVLADIACSAWNIQHTHYHIAFEEVFDNAAFIHFDFALLIKVIFGAICFGLASLMFSKLSHGIKKTSQRLISAKWLVPFVGGLIVIGLTYLIGNTSYLGLGVSNPDPNGVSILTAFNEGGADTFSWFWKLLFTAVTLGMGFKGGEVTPLFFIGATLGNTIAVLTGAPIDLMAGLGFIAVFAGATNTPIACTIMGIELFGGEYVMYYAVACFVAYYFSGHTGIYQSQRIGYKKVEVSEIQTDMTLKDIGNPRSKR